MTNGKDLNHRQFPYAGPILMCGLACLFWTALVPNGNESRQSDYEETVANLAVGQEAVDSFKQVWKSVPLSLSELKTFAAAQRIDFSGFDAFGNRLQYVRLSDEHYLLRSFGADNRQASVFTDADPYVSSWPELPSTTPAYRFLSELSSTMYPSPVILGMHSPNKNWYAQIFSDAHGGSRQLVIRNPEKNRFLIAPHDLVEEFLWLPNSYQIAFTATSSAKYRDGIYLWNILTDEISNLLDLRNRESTFFAQNSDQRYFLSLAGVTAESHELLAYIAPGNAIALNPVDFFNTDQLYRIRLPSPGIDPELRRAQLTSPSPLRKPPLSIGAGILGNEHTNNVYHEWLSLSFSGDLERTIHDWQNFSERHASSPIFPYCLWFLASIYNDASRVVAPVAEKDAQVLRAYGAELAEALAQLPSSPSYLRAFGVFIYENLVAGEALPYRVSQLELPQQGTVSKGN